MLNKLITAVKEIDKATSPLANLVSTFDVTPPGAAAIIINPTAIEVGKSINKIIKIAIIGSKINWHKNPMIKSFGNLTTLMKSFNERPRPKVNMIIINAKGAIVVTISKFFLPLSN